MHIAADSVLLPAHHKGNLAVCLKAQQTVDHMTARFLQHLRPHDIVFLVKPGFQLHQHGHLLAVLRRLGQGRNDRGIAADPVKSLLDCQHVLIPCRLPDEVHHGRKGLIGVMQEDILLPDLFKHITVRGEGRNRLGCGITLFLEMVEAEKPVHFHQKGQIQGAVNAVNILIAYGKLLLDNGKETFVNPLFHLQTDGLSPLPFFQLFFNLLEKILGFILLQGKVSVSHDTERIGAHNVIAQKELMDIPLDHLLQKNHRFLLIFPCGYAHDSGENAWHLYGGKLQLLVPLLFPHKGSYIQGFVADQR